MRAAWLVLVAACSVPALDVTGKTCPCSDDFVCIADHCVRNGGDGGSSMCLGTAPGTMLYSDNFDGASIDSGWMTNGGSWAQTSGALEQSDTGEALGYALTTHVSQPDYRVVVQMTGDAGGTSMGIVVRGALGNRTQYDCMWQPGTLIVQATNNGGNPTTIASKPGLPNGGAAQTVTMEVLVHGHEIACCLDNVGGALVDVTNPSPDYPMGQPGVVTTHMHARFDNFAVYAN